MSRIYVTFSGSRYHEQTQRIVEDAPKLGADAVWVYDNWWLEHCRPEYWRKMEWFRNHRHKNEERARGVDFFCFKPFVLLDALSRASDKDIILYSDADCFPIADLSPLFEQCERDNGVMLFNARGCVAKEWTKRDAFILTGCDTPEYHNAWQAVARFMLFQKGNYFPVRKFLGQWLGFTANPLINTFDPSIIEPDQPELKEPRCEQAVLGLLAQRCGVKLHREACEFGCWDQPEDHPEVPERYRYGVPYQMFSQQGRHTYRPGYTGDESEGSVFRNVHE